MAGQENFVRVTRAARKRAAALATVEEQPMLKKRVVLGELPMLSNTVVSVDDYKKKSTKSKPKARNVKKKASVVKRDEAPIHYESNVDPQMCGPYASDIYNYLHKLEMDQSRRPLADYIEKIQKDVTPNMRGILVDWLVEVADEYKLCSDSLYLTVDYIDRYLSKNTLSRQRLQLLGVSSMLIASKYEEINPPNVEDFCYITDNTYTKDDVVNMEADILKLLKFELGNPTVKTFLRRLTQIAQEGHKSSHLQLEFLGHYLAELSLLDYNCVKFLPSLVASSVIFLARFILKPKLHPWSAALQQQSGYIPCQLKECILVLHDLYLSRRAHGLQAVREKYRQQKFKCVASVPSPPEIPPSYFGDVEEPPLLNIEF